MMYRIPTTAKFTCFLLIGFFIAGLARAQVSMVSERIDHIANLNGIMTIQVDKGQLVIDMAATDDDNPVASQMIFNSSDPSMTIVDHAMRSVMFIDSNAADRLSQQMQQQASAVQSQLANIPMDQLPPEARKQLQEALEKSQSMMNGEGNVLGRGVAQSTGSGGDSAPEPVATGEKGQFAGVSCTYYELDRPNKREIERLCVAEMTSFSGGNELNQSISDMMQFIQDLVGEMGDGMGMSTNNPFSSSGVLLEKGLFPIHSQTFGIGYEGTGNRILKEEITLQSIERKVLDSADFEPPSGYKRMSMGDM